MNALDAAFCGAAGGLVVELVVFYRAIGRVGGFPWRKDPENEPGPAALITALLCRMAIGGVLAWFYSAGGQVAGVLGAFTTGVAADLIIERIHEGKGKAPLPPEATDPQPTVEKTDA